MAGSVHRSTWLKQKNKAHKSTKSHKTKRELSRAFGGRVESVAASAKSTASKSTLGSRLNRQNKAKLVREKKRSALIDERRKTGVFSKKSKASGAPLNIAIIPLAENCNPEGLSKVLRSSGDTCVDTNFGSLITSKSFKVKINLFNVDGSKTLEVLDACKCADQIIFLINPVGNETDPSKYKLETLLEHLVSERGKSILDALKAQGMPSCIVALENFSLIPQKLQPKIKIQSALFFSQEFGEEVKVLPLESNEPQQENIKEKSKMAVDEVSFSDPSKSSALQLIRMISEIKVKTVTWRSDRSYLTANRVGVEGSEVFIDGYIRGSPFSVNSLVHVVGYGNFQISKISSETDPLKPLHMQTNDKQTFTANFLKVPSLKREAEPDMFAGEQTWPTEEEMGGKEYALEQAKKRVDTEEDYMAAWDVDDSGSEISLEEFANMRIDDNVKSVSFKKEEALKRIKQEEADEMHFPDETEAPHEIAAKDRFVKYRGLKSFKDSFWHPKESLPRQYSYIYQLDNPAAISNQLKKENEDRQESFLKLIQEEDENNYFTLPTQEDDNSWIAPGNYCRLFLKIDESISEHKHMFNDFKTGDVPKTVMLFQLLEHEQKLTVLTANVKKNANADSDLPLKSKETLTVQCGFWRMKAKPVFSENNLNCEKHKFLKFLPDDYYACATFYGTITFGQLPVMFFREDSESGKSELVAYGALRSEKEGLNVDRIILKRIVLTGYPIRIKKNKAVVRFMFHSADDVRWFKPVQLWTKIGASGEIVDSVGTHGLFKSRFDRHLKSNDTICMSLFKRIFPKLPDEELIK